MMNMCLGRSGSWHKEIHQEKKSHKGRVIVTALSMDVGRGGRQIQKETVATGSLLFPFRVLKGRGIQVVPDHLGHLLVLLIGQDGLPAVHLKDTAPLFAALVLRH